MIYKNTIVKKEELSEFLKKYKLEYDSQLNHSPLVGYKIVQITEAEFCQSKFFGYNADYTEYRQVKPEFLEPLNPSELDYYKTPLWNRVKELRFFYTGGYVYAIGYNYYEKNITYWRVGCVHDFKELSTSECQKLNIQHYGNCWHVNECKKCGFTNSYDSSG